MLLTAALLHRASLPMAGEKTRVLFQEDFVQPLGDRWQPVKFEVLTEYQVLTGNPNRCLRAACCLLTPDFRHLPSSIIHPLYSAPQPFAISAFHPAPFPATLLSAPRKGR
jgi:hypothetical protein